MASLRLKIELENMPSPVIRVVEIPADATLFALHRIIQEAFDWASVRLYQFVQDGARWTPWPRHHNEAFVTGVRVSDLINKAGDELFYLYDFNDMWLHRITVLAAPPTRPTKARLLDAIGPAAFEGAGGPAVWSAFVAEVERAAQTNTDVELFFDYYIENFHDFSPSELLRNIGEINPTRIDMCAQAVAEVNCYGELARKRMELDEERLEELNSLDEKESLDGWTTTHVRWSRSYGRPIDLPDYKEYTDYLDFIDFVASGNIDEAEQALMEFMAVQRPLIEEASVTARIVERARERGALGALADYFANSMLFEMVRLHKQDTQELSDEQAGDIGQRLKKLLALATLGHSREAIVDKYLSDHGRLREEDGYKGLWEHIEELFVITGLASSPADQPDGPLVTNEETERMLALTPAELTRVMLDRIPAHQGIEYITTILGLLNRVYGVQAREQLALLRGVSPAAILDEFYNQLSGIYFPPEVYPGVDYPRIGAFIDRFHASTGAVELLQAKGPSLPGADTIMFHGRVCDVADGVTGADIAGEQPQPLDEALVAFMRECLRHVDAAWFTPVGEGPDPKVRKY